MKISYNKKSKILTIDNENAVIRGICPIITVDKSVGKLNESGIHLCFTSFILLGNKHYHFFERLKESFRRSFDMFFELMRDLK